MKQEERGMKGADVATRKGLPDNETTEKTGRKSDC